VDSSIEMPPKHIVHRTNESEPKARALLAALELHQPKSAVISCNDASECDLLARFLSRYGYRTFVCSDDHKTRFAEALNNLSHHAFDILLCQNNLISGVDLHNVAFMINYDAIERPELYERITQYKTRTKNIRRIIINLLSNREFNFISSLKSYDPIEIDIVDLPSHDDVINLSSKRLITKLNDDAAALELGQYEELAQSMLEQKLNAKMVPAMALLLRHYFLKSLTPQDRPSLPPRAARESRVPEKQEHHHEEKSASGSTRLYVTLGRQDGFNDLASLAQFLSERSSVDLGHFSGSGMLRDRSTHVEVDDEVAQRIIDAVHNSPRPELNQNDRAPIVCERARQNNERTQRRPPMRRGAHFQRRRHY
jgi:hypothetical protein